MSNTPGQTAGGYQNLEEQEKLNPSEGTPKDQRSMDQPILTEDGVLDENVSLTREWISLMVIFLIALGNQWQRFLLAYVNGVGTDKNDPKLEIATFYSEYWSTYYGILSGLAFTFTFACFGIFGGLASDYLDRKMIIVVCSIGWSLCTLFSGIIPSFWVFFLMRILLGFFQAFMNPAAYSMIADYFPPSKRTRASSVYNIAIYFGGGMASLSQVLINNAGWKFTYTIVSLIGLGSSVIGLFIIKSPKRGRWEKKKDQPMGEIKQTQQRSTIQKFLAALSEIFQNPTCRWVAIGGFFRFFGGFSIGFFLPKFFNLIWPSDDLKNAYAISNAFVVSLFGLCSALIGGWVGDAMENKGILMTKAYICILSAIFGSIFFCLCVLPQIESTGGFVFAILMLALEYLSAENWIAPAITMLMNTISSENKGFAVSAYLFFCSLGGTLATGIAQPLFNHYEVKKYPGRSGNILAVLVLISYIGSIPWFFFAGRTYSAFKKKEQEENERKQNQGF